MKKEDRQMLVEFIILMAFFYLIPAFTLWKFNLLTEYKDQDYEMPIKG